MADAARGADRRGVDHFGVELDEQIVRGTEAHDGLRLPRRIFLKRDHGCQAVNRLTFKMFCALKLPAFATVVNTQTAITLPIVGGAQDTETWRDRFGDYNGEKRE